MQVGCKFINYLVTCSRAVKSDAKRARRFLPPDRARLIFVWLVLFSRRP